MNSQLPGLTGLRNLGNTCYMNAVLQCLCSVPSLVEYFVSGKYKAALHKENEESVTAFGHVIVDMWLREFDCVSPEVFHSVLEKRYPTFSRMTQQDAQEFLICVLNELHEAFKKSSKARCVSTAGASRGSVSETSIITELFEGQLTHNITCLKCKTTTRRPESFTVLSLPIPSKQSCSLQDCLKCFFQQDTLTWNNQIHCSWCGSKQDAAVTSTITKAPEIIIFHLKRPKQLGLLSQAVQKLLTSGFPAHMWPDAVYSEEFILYNFPSMQKIALGFECQGNDQRKLSADIHYPLSGLDLSPYSSPLFCQEAEYSLCAVVNHAGSLDNGHYTAFCKHSVTKNWYSFDDTQITKIPNSSVQTDRAYLLFYTCQDLHWTH